MDAISDTIGDAVDADPEFDRINITWIRKQRAKGALEITTADASTTGWLEQTLNALDVGLKLQGHVVV